MQKNVNNIYFPPAAAERSCSVAERLQRLVENIKQLDDKAYNGYFEEKLNNLYRLEEELRYIESLTPLQWREYRIVHCLRIRSRHSLACEIFYWQHHYLKQVSSTIRYLKELKQCLTVIEQ